MECVVSVCEMRVSQKWWCGHLFKIPSSIYSSCSEWSVYANFLPLSSLYDIYLFLDGACLEELVAILPKRVDTLCLYSDGVCRGLTQACTCLLLWILALKGICRQWSVRACSISWYLNWLELGICCFLTQGICDWFDSFDLLRWRYVDLCWCINIIMSGCPCGK